MYCVVVLAVLCLAHPGLGYENPEDLPFGTSFLSPLNKAEYTKTEKEDRGKFLKEVYEQATEEMKKDILGEVVPKCYSWWLTESQRSEIESLHASGDHKTCKDKIRDYLTQLPTEKQENIKSYWAFCEHLWYVSHSAHNHHQGHKHARRGLRPARHVHTTFEDFAAEHLQWLSDDEKAEVKKLHDDDKQKARERITEILEASTGEKKEKGIASLQAACRELIVETLGEDVANDLKKMKESGSTHEQIDQKATELIQGLTDEEKKKKASEYKAVCKRIYGLKTGSQRRRRHEQHHHDLEAKLKSEWKWLTAEQMEEIRKLKNEGKNDEFLLAKVFEYFKNAEDKNAAEDGLQTSCGAAILNILGAEKAEELKAYMANGATPEAYEQKVKELLNSAPKKTLTKNQESCKNVFTTASRRRRDHHHHHKTLEEFLEHHLDWLSDTQKEELKQLKKDGKTSDEIHAKVMEFYASATGETKEKAIADMKMSCEEVVPHLITEEQMTEIKKLRESGASQSEVFEKVVEFIKTITDDEKVKEAQKYTVNCKKIFGITSRRRRDEEHDRILEEYLQSSNSSWLTDAEKDTLRKLVQEKAGREEIQKQFFAYFDATTGEAREQAAASVQASCRKVFTGLLGEEKANELTTMKESGTSTDDMRKKVDQFIEEIADEKKKQDAKFFAVGCRKAFGVEEKKTKRHVYRHRRDHHHEGEQHTLEDLFKTYLSWLTEDQQKELTEFKAAGKARKELHEEIVKYYDNANDSVKEVARQKMQDGCKKILLKVLGEEKVNELRKMRESGSPIQEVFEKTRQFIAELTDENLKKSAEEYKAMCSKAFNVE